MTLYRARVWPLGEGPPNAPDFTLTLSHLSGVPIIGGQRIRPGDGKLVSSPYTLQVNDVASIITSRWGDAESARPNMLGRLVAYERSEDGVVWEALDIGRISGFGEASGPGQYRIEVSDETWAGRAATLWERTRGIQLYPFGPAASWGPAHMRVDAAGIGSFVVSGIDGSAVQLSPQQAPENIPPAMCSALREDLTYPLQRTADKADGNFASLRCDVSKVEGLITSATLRVIAFGGSSLGASGSVRNILDRLDPELGDEDRRLPPVWVYWPGHGFSSAELQEVEAVLHFPAGPGLPVSEDLPYYAGGTEGVHLGELWASVLRGEHGGEPLRVSEASLAELETSDLPRIWLRQTSPASDRMAWLAERGGLGLFLHQIAPDPIDGLRILDLRSPDADEVSGDIDSLPILDASTVRGHTWESSGREIVTRLAVDWRRVYRSADRGPSIDRLVTSTIPTERSHDNAAYVGDHVRRYQLDLIPGGAADPTHLTTVLAADSFALLGDGALIRRLHASAIDLDLEVGQLVRLDAESLAAPNPVTHARSGVRLCRILEVAEAPAHYEVTLLDMGAALQPLPAITVSITQVPTDLDLLRVQLSLGEDMRAELEIAHTDSAAQPDDDQWEIRDADLTDEEDHTYSLRRSGGHFHVRARATAPGRVSGPWAYDSVAGATRALIEDASVTLSGETPIITGTAGADTHGVRIHYAVHDDGEEPTWPLPTTRDYAASGLAGGLALPASVGPGQRITAEVEGWTGWTGSAVSGTAGPRVSVSAVASPEGMTGIRWRGEHPAPPPDPRQHDAYRNTVDGIVYIYIDGEWEVLVRDGEEGPPGPAGASVEVRYSGPTPGANISATFNPALHLYMQTRRTDQSWPSEWARIVGEDGTDGVDGGYTDYRFRAAATQPATPTGPDPSGWSDAPPTPGTGEYLWMSRAQRHADGTLVGTWSTPVRLTGPQGPEGPPGPPGTDYLPPVCWIEPESYEELTAQVRIHGRDWEGSPSGLEYQYRTYPLDADEPGDWGEWAQIPAGGAAIVVTIPAKVPTVVEAMVRDAEERESAPVQHQVQPRLRGIEEDGLVSWREALSGTEPPPRISGVPIGELVAQGVEPSQNLLPVWTNPEAEVEVEGGLDLEFEFLLPETPIAQLGLQGGETLTVAVDVMTTGAGNRARPQMMIRRIDDTTSYHNPPVYAGTEWDRRSFTVTLPTDTASIYIRYLQEQGATGVATFRRAMLTRGTIPLPYEDPPLRPGRGEGYRDIPGHLPPWVRLESVGTPRVLVSGAQEFAAYDEDEDIVLDPPYEDAPLVIVQGPMAYHDGLTGKQYRAEYAEDVTASEIGRIVCKMIDVSGSTPASAFFPPGVLTSEGDRSDPVAIATPADDSRYRVSWTGTLQALAGPGPFDRADAEIVIAVSTRETPSDPWIERQVRPFSATAIGGPGPVQDIIGNVEIAVSQVDEISISIKRLTVSSIGSPGGVIAAVSPGSVRWQTMAVTEKEQTDVFPARVIVLGAFGG